MEGTTRRTIIGVMGGADPDLPPKVLEDAEAVGRGIADAGAVLLCGGRTGVMEAAARGARSVPCGETLAVLPGPDPDRANPFMDQVVATGLGNGRNVINVLSSDAVIALPGGAGTLSEASLALKCGIHVVSLGSWDLAAAAPAEARNLVRKYFHPVRTPEEAVARALHHARRRPPTPDEDRKRILNFVTGWIERRESPDRTKEGGLRLKIVGRGFCFVPDVPDYVALDADTRRIVPPDLKVLSETLDMIPLPGRVFLLFFRARAAGEGEEPKSFACTLLLREWGDTFRVLARQLLPVDMERQKKGEPG